MTDTNKLITYQSIATLMCSLGVEAERKDTEPKISDILNYEKKYVNPDGPEAIKVITNLLDSEIKLQTELKELKEKYDKLRNAAMTMQVAVGRIFLTGGLDIEKWFDYLPVAQRNLASSTQGKHMDYEQARVRLDKLMEEDRKYL